MALINRTRLSEAQRRALTDIHDYVCIHEAPCRPRDVCPSVSSALLQAGLISYCLSKQATGYTLTEEGRRVLYANNRTGD